MSIAFNYAFTFTSHTTLYQDINKKGVFFFASFSVKPLSFFIRAEAYLIGIYYL